MSTIGDYIKKERKKAGLTQEDFAIRSGLGLRFVRELEQGKETVRLDKVNQALAMFGKEAVPGKRRISRWSQNIERDMYIFKIIFGIIAETEEGYIFTYDQDYLDREDAVAVSLTLPLRQEPYETTILFPFFDGLIPEGWLLGVVSRNWKINQKDRFGLLLSACRDCIGDVCIRREKV
ncbi:MAG: type II toxin-antitoxin system Y4mF family antitoxin [Blautia wexlerae]